MRIAFALTIALALVFGVAALQAQPAGGTGATPPAMGQPSDRGGMMPQMDDKAMEKMGMDKNMRMFHKGMMSAEVTPNDPAVLMGMKDDLKLTPEQVDKLKKIQSEATDKAKEVLTAEQKTMVDQIKGQPKTMQEMHQMMWKKMQENRMGGGMGAPGGAGGMGGGAGGGMGGGAGGAGGGMK